MICEYCGRYPEGETVWYALFREEEYLPDGYVYEYDKLFGGRIKVMGGYIQVFKYYFCCQGHSDAFFRETSLTSVNSHGFTDDEQNERDEKERLQKEYKRSLRKCNQCDKMHLPQNGAVRGGLNFCSVACSDIYFLKVSEAKVNINLKIDQSSLDFGYDDLFEAAANFVVIHQLCSTNLIQRKFSIGYNRAGRIIDQLVSTGIVSYKAEGANRKVFYQMGTKFDEYLKNILK